MKKSVTLETYLAGLKNVDLNQILVAGENMAENRMEISIYDLPSWIRSDANFKLKMLPQDFKLIREFFRRPKSKIFVPAGGGGLVHMGVMRPEDFGWKEEHA